MKQILLFFILLLNFPTLQAQDITGFWYGYPDMKTHRLRMSIEIKSTDSHYTATLKMPDISERTVTTSDISFKDSLLSIRFSEIRLYCQGRYQNEEIVGTITQGEYTFELKLTRQPVVFKRPQTPQPPFPYTSEEIQVRNETANITLAGTLTLPKQSGKCKAVLLLSGSGPQDRDNTFFEHKTFLVIADYFARQGIATLRMDDRGTGSSEGNFETSGLPDFTTDAQAALHYLKQRPEIDTNYIGVIGHSEGAFSAFSLAAQQETAFIITMAGGGVNGKELLLMQRAALLRESGAQEALITQYNHYMRQAQEIVLQTGNPSACEKRLAELFNGTPLAGQAAVTTRQLYNPNKIELLKYDPEDDFARINCPVLALNGTKDCQVPIENLTYIQQGITANGNKQVTIISYPDLNHMFQTAQKGLPVEYADIEETIYPQVLKDMTTWIKALK